MQHYPKAAQDNKYSTEVICIITDWIADSWLAGSTEFAFQNYQRVLACVFQATTICEGP